MFFINERRQKTESLETAWEWKRSGLKVKQFTFVLGTGTVWETDF